MTSGIYTITSPSGGQYVGSAVDFDSRRRVHFHLLRQCKHHNPGLRRACKKYGIENLRFAPLLVCRREDLIFFEQRAIDVLKPRYNACPTAGSQLGRFHSKATIAKISANRTGKGAHPPERKQKTSERMKGNRFNVGRTLGPETRSKISESLKNKTHSDGFEQRATQAQKLEIVRLYQSGNGQNFLASKYKTYHKVIRRILVAAGVQISRSGHTIKRTSP